MNEQEIKVFQEDREYEYLQNNFRNLVPSQYQRWEELKEIIEARKLRGNRDIGRIIQIPPSNIFYTVDKSSQLYEESTKSSSTNNFSVKTNKLESIFDCQRIDLSANRPNFLDQSISIFKARISHKFEKCVKKGIDIFIDSPEKSFRSEMITDPMDGFGYNRLEYRYSVKEDDMYRFFMLDDCSKESVQKCCDYALKKVKDFINNKY